MVMTTREKEMFRVFYGVVAVVLAISCLSAVAQAAKGPVDPGVRGGASGAGNPLPGLTADETAFFKDGLAKFADVEVVTGGNNNGLGPRSTRTSACRATRSRLGA